MIKIIKKTVVSEATCGDCGYIKDKKDVVCPECGSKKQDISIKLGSKRVISYSPIQILFWVIVALVSIPSFYFSITVFSEETLFWFFSSVLQAFIALIALLAVVVT